MSENILEQLKKQLASAYTEDERAQAEDAKKNQFEYEMRTIGELKEAIARVFNVEQDKLLFRFRTDPLIEVDVFSNGTKPEDELTFTFQSDPPGTFWQTYGARYYDRNTLQLKRTCKACLGSYYVGLSSSLQFGKYLAEGFPEHPACPALVSPVEEVEVPAAAGMGEEPITSVPATEVEALIAINTTLLHIRNTINSIEEKGVGQFIVRTP